MELAENLNFKLVRGQQFFGGVLDLNLNFSVSRQNKKFKLSENEYHRSILHRQKPQIPKIQEANVHLLRKNRRKMCENSAKLGTKSALFFVLPGFFLSLF